MDFKDDKSQKEFEGAPLLLKLMLFDADDFSVRHFQKSFVVTRVLGEVVVGDHHDSGVHEDYRAVDVRDEHDGAFSFAPNEIQLILDYINCKYERNDGFPSVIHHSFNGLPYHFHFQISTLTKTYMPGGK